MTHFLSFVYVTSDASAVNVITTLMSVIRTQASVSARITPSVTIAHVAKMVSMATRPRGLRTTASHAHVCLENNAFSLAQKSSARIVLRAIKVIPLWIYLFSCQNHVARCGIPRVPNSRKSNKQTRTILYTAKNEQLVAILLKAGLNNV